MSHSAEMRRVREERTIAQEQLALVMQDMRKVVREASDGGYSVSAIANSTGLTRQSVYDFLKE